MLTKFITALILVSLALVFVATATASHNGNIVTKVSNFDLTSDSIAEFTAQNRSQAFYTGTHDPGYTFSSVKVKSEDAEGDAFAVSLCETSQGFPTSRCQTLSAPSSFAAGELEFRFSGPGRFDLAARTTYAVLLSGIGGATVTIDATTSDDEDDGAATGWDITNWHHFEQTSGQWLVDSHSRSIRIEILASEIVSDNARLSSLGLTGAALSKPFSPTIENYRTDVVANSTTQITLNPTKSNSAASFRYLDADNTALTDADGATDFFQVDIDPGDTLVKIEVTAEDGTKNTYNLAVLRAVQTTEERDSCGSSRDNACELRPTADSLIYGTIDPAGDDDWGQVRLEDNTNYTVSVHQDRHLGADRLRCRTLDVYAPNNTRVGGFKSGIARMFDGAITHSFTPNTSGLHKFKVTGSCYTPDGPRSNVPDTGSYKVTVVSSTTALSISETSSTGDLPATTGTAGQLLANAPVTGRLSSGSDSDCSGSMSPATISTDSPPTAWNTSSSMTTQAISFGTTSGPSYLAAQATSGQPTPGPTTLR